MKEKTSQNHMPSPYFQAQSNSSAKMDLIWAYCDHGKTFTQPMQECLTKQAFQVSYYITTMLF